MISSSSATHKYLPATLIVGTCSLIELIIVPIIPDIIAQLVLAGLGFCLGIAGLVLAAHLDYEYINRKRIVITQIGSLIWVLSLILSALGGIAGNRIGGIIFYASSVLLYITGLLMIIIPGYKLSVATLPFFASFGRVSKLLVLIPLTISFCCHVILKIIFAIEILTRGGLFFFLSMAAFINMIVVIICSLIMFAGLIVGIVRFIKESREIEIPKHLVVVSA